MKSINYPVLFFGLLISLLILARCSSKNDDQEKNQSNTPLLDRHFNSADFAGERKALKSTLTKQIKLWSQTVNVMKIYERYDWRISDNILMNKVKTKALVFTCFIKKTGHGKVDMIAAEKVNGAWIFFKRGMPSFNYEYDNELRNGVPLAENEIFRLSVLNLINDGLIRNGKVDEDYINIKWFRENRMETRNQFLNNQY